MVISNSNERSVYIHIYIDRERDCEIESKGGGVPLAFLLNQHIYEHGNVSHPPLK